MFFNSKPFCESCYNTASDKALINNNHLSFSEAKEEETECQYCARNNIQRPAETLFNGYPSCKECKKKNCYNFVSSAQNGQKIVVTQIMKDEFKPNQQMILQNVKMRPSLIGGIAGQMNISIDTKQSLDLGQPQNPGGNPILVTPTNAMKTDITHNSSSNMAVGDNNTTSSATTGTATTGTTGTTKGTTTGTTTGQNKFKNNIKTKGKFDFSSKTDLDICIDTVNAATSPPLDIQPFLTTRNADIDHDRKFGHFFGEKFGVTLIPQFFDQPISKTNNNNQAKNLPLTPRNIMDLPISSICISPVKRNENVDPRIGELINKLLNGGSGLVKGNILYQASKDSLNSKVFHMKCDNKGSIIIAVLLKSNELIGGYIQKSIDSKTIEMVDPGSGVYYTSDNKSLIFQKLNKNIISYKKTGIALGNPIMFEMNLDSLNSLIWNVNLKHRYKASEWKKQIQDIVVLKYQM